LLGQQAVNPFDTAERQQVAAEYATRGSQENSPPVSGTNPNDRRPGCWGSFLTPTYGLTN
ncbi:hypothetical protein, partial [uncultured Lamprocystis sp.]|uniref:hypothetical protein n=1 Tax=uncultured Lamprocystis sp. TaxID=543132 RepID=UPI0025DE498F